MGMRNKVKFNKFLIQLTKNEIEDSNSFVSFPFFRIQTLKEFTKNANVPTEVAISHDGRVVAFQERDTNNCNVWIWDSHTMEYRMTTIVHGHGGASIPVLMTPDGSLILTGGEIENFGWKAHFIYFCMRGKQTRITRLNL